MLRRSEQSRVCGSVESQSSATKGFSNEALQNGGGKVKHNHGQYLHIVSSICVSVFFGMYGII